MSLEKRIKEAMYGKGDLGAPKPKTKQRRVSDVVERMTPEQRRMIYDQIVETGFGDEAWD